MEHLLRTSALGWSIGLVHGVERCLFYTFIRDFAQERVEDVTGS